MNLPLLSQRRAASAADTHDHASHATVNETVDSGWYWPRALSLRVVIAAAYFVLIPAGLLPMSTPWWLASGGSLLVYAIAMLALLLVRPRWLWPHRAVSPYTDTFMISLAIVALARPDYPIWIGYFLVISSTSAVQSSRSVLMLCGFVLAAYWGSIYTLQVLDRASMSWQLATVVSIMAVFTATNADVIATSNKRLRRLVLEASLTDPLTGLANRRRFREVLDAHAATPGTKPLAVLMYDLDNFKGINEQYGHVYADELLVRVCSQLKACFRDADAIARYGGDELVVLAHVNALEDAMAMAERSLKQVREHVGVNLSAGVAVYPLTSVRIDDVVTAADNALGDAKHSGKARVMLAPGLAAA